MVILCIIHIAHPNAVLKPSLANSSNFAPLFGVCVYAFMCHHSLPALLTPIRYIMLYNADLSIYRSEFLFFYKTVFVFV